MSEIHSVYSVFTPTTQARLNFVPRKTVNDQFVDALRTPGKQLIVFGESGSGKSTLLLRKLEELYPAHITSRCSATMDFSQLLLDAFDQLDEYYIEERSTGRERELSTGLVADFSRIRASIDASLSTSTSEGSRRVIPPQLTPQRLGQFLGAKGLCWIVEDFHKMPAEEKVPLAQSLKIFSDLAASFPDVKIVTVGATETARQVVEYDPEMVNRVSELLVPLMNEEELQAILVNGQRLLHLDLSALIDPIVQHSVGVASVCHQLALNVCLEKSIVVTSYDDVALTEDDLRPAIERYIRESSDTLKAAFDKALKRHKVRKYDNTRMILQAVASGPLDGMLHADIMAVIRRGNPDYPPGNLTLYLAQLTSDERGAILRRGVDGRYRFIDPLHHTFAQVTLLPSPAATKRDSSIAGYFLEAVTNWIETAPAADVWFALGDTTQRPALYFEPKVERSSPE